MSAPGVNTSPQNAPSRTVNDVFSAAVVDHPDPRSETATDPPKWFARARMHDEMNWYWRGESPELPHAAASPMLPAYESVVPPAVIVTVLFDLSAHETR